MCERCIRFHGIVGCVNDTQNSLRGAKCFVELGTCPSFNQWFSSLDEKEMNLDW
jgi:hypothetical protein